MITCFAFCFEAIRHDHISKVDAETKTGGTRTLPQGVYRTFKRFTCQIYVNHIDGSGGQTRGFVMYRRLYLKRNTFRVKAWKQKQSRMPTLRPTDSWQPLRGWFSVWMKFLMFIGKGYRLSTSTKSDSYDKECTYVTFVTLRSEGPDTQELNIILSAILNFTSFGLLLMADFDPINFPQLELHHSDSKRHH